MLISFFLRFNVPRHIVDSSLDCAYEVDPFAIMLEKGYKYAYWLYFYDNNLKTGQTLWRAVGDYINWKKITPKSGFSNLAAHFPSPVQGEFHRVSFLLLLSFSPLQQPTAHISPTPPSVTTGTMPRFWTSAFSGPKSTSSFLPFWITLAGFSNTAGATPSSGPWG